MLRIGGTASPGHLTVFRGLKTHFQQQGIALDWVLYADYDALVEAFVTREIDLAWNGPISYVQIKQRLPAVAACLSAFADATRASPPWQT